jgi:signal transduction histidine kinase
MLCQALTFVIRYNVSGISPGVVFFDLSSQHFNQRIRSAQYYASLLAYFGSEESIIEGRHLKWFEGEQRIRTTQRDYDSGGFYHWDYNDGIIVSSNEIYERATISEDFYYPDTGDYYPDVYDDEDIIVNWLSLRTPDGNFHYRHVSEPFIINNFDIFRASFEQEAIQIQLSEFRNARKHLSDTGGLLFYTVSAAVTNQSVNDQMVLEGAGAPDSELEYPQLQTFIHSNVDYKDAIMFDVYPVYFIKVGNEPAVHYPRDIDYVWYEFSQQDYTEIYLAFTHGTVYAHERMSISVRDAYIFDFTIIAASAVLILISFIILLCGAGRIRIVNEGEVEQTSNIHLTLFDKPYLDIGLAAVSLWTMFGVLLSFQVVDSIWNAATRNTHSFWAHSRVDTLTSMRIFIAVAVLLIAPPLLLWIMNFAKRVKAGRFWKHTLIHAVLYRCLYCFLRFCVRKVRSQWAGINLTIRVALISVTAFFMMLFVGLVSGVSFYFGFAALFISLLFTAVVAFFLLRYANRIHRIEIGARKTTEGNYDTPIDAGGGELGSIASSINNISAGINAAVEQRMKSERFKTELITNVSHDIRTPLTSIITYTDLLKHEGLDCEKAPEYLDVLIQKSQRLKTLTDDLFEASKAVTGNIEVNLTELDIVSLINQVLGELDEVIKSSGFDLRVNLPDRQPVVADGKLMWRVLENLLSNVFKYSLAGSRVYLTVHVTDELSVQIAIKNISAAELNFDPSELTERFKRGDNSRSDEGSGLGLSIVQSFIHAQGGQFSISIDGDLFKATVTLPTPKQDL